MDENKKKLPHTLIVEDRRKLSLTGITDVGNFDEEGLSVYTDFGEVSVKGENIQVNILNVETGQFEAEGKFTEIKYSDRVKASGGFFSKVFK